MRKRTLTSPFQAKQALSIKVYASPAGKVEAAMFVE
jgi:hypothetical protein